MPRYYKPTRVRKYTMEDVSNCVRNYFDAVADGHPKTIKEIAESRSIPRTTLSDHINARHKGLERKIGSGNTTILAARFGWHFQKAYIVKVVSAYCLSRGKKCFNGSYIPGKEWMLAFNKR